MQRTDKTNYYLDIAETVLSGALACGGTLAPLSSTTMKLCPQAMCAPRGRKNCIDMGICIREKLGIPRGERYELCRSVHAEANAIISAPRNEMIGATLYLVGREMKTGGYVANTAPCSMCKRLIINAGILRVIARINKTEYTVTNVNDYVTNDESLVGKFGY